MEYLTKQQIILLALLVSFVSSTASSIVTVSLLGQSTPTVTQTINRVVERTIEKVSPSATTTTETIIVKDDQATVDAIARASRSIVRLVDGGTVVAMGILVSNGGRIAAITDASMHITGARLEGGNAVGVQEISRDQRTGVTIFQAEQSTDPRSTRVYTPALLAGKDSVKLGQSVIAIGGREAPLVATGIVSSLRDGKIYTGMKESDFDSRGILVNLLGEVVGMKDLSTENAFISSQSLN
jgi:hypothetical protein